MNAIRVETVVEKDGELHLSSLPCKRGDRVEAIVLIQEETATQKRDEALRRFLSRARASAFRSLDSYPKRDELHERP